MPLTDYDKRRLTLEATSQDWYKLVFRPFLDAELEQAEAALEAARDPWQRYGWCDYRNALRNIDKQIQLWLLYKPHADEDETGTGYERD